jgi:sterol 3beta-glucosyltransferase
MSPSRRIAIITYGSRGDVEPFLALAVGLRNAGHRVRISAPAPYAGLAGAQEIEFHAIQGNPDELAHAFADRPDWCPDGTG